MSASGIIDGQPNPGIIVIQSPLITVTLVPVRPPRQRRQEMDAMC